MRFFVFVFPLLLSACFLVPHKIEVQQGNFIDEKMVSKLKLDMTRDQVLFAMGTPLIIDPFHPNRWDYVYLIGKTGDVKRVTGVTLEFDGNRLVRITGNVVPNGQGVELLINAAK